MTEIKIPIGIRLNNPGNIRYNEHNRFLGLVGKENGFCKFESPVYGVRAVCVVLRNYMRRNIRTISAIIDRYAPASDGNNTTAYIDYVSKRLAHAINPDAEKDSRFPVDAPLCWQSSTFLLLVQAMLFYESHYETSIEEIREAYKLMDCY